MKDFHTNGFLNARRTRRSVQPGNVLYIPELSTGAGEFEAVRFVSSPNEEEKESSEENQNQLLPLLGAGIEYLEFPESIIELAKSVQDLRQAYADIFDAVLAKEAKMTLQDLMGGGPTGIDDFWNDPPKQRPKRTKSDEKCWLIPLNECQIDIAQI